jgi:hypothetical protein
LLINIFNIMRNIKSALRSSYARNHIKEIILSLVFTSLIVICCLLSNECNGKYKTLIHNLDAIGIHVSVILAFELIKKRKLPKKKIQRVAIVYSVCEERQLANVSTKIKETIDKLNRLKAHRTILFISKPVAFTRQEAATFFSRNKEKFDHCIWYDVQSTSNKKGEKLVVKHREITKSLSKTFAVLAHFKEKSLGKVDFCEVLLFDLGIYCLSSANNIAALTLLKDMYTYRDQNAKANFGKKRVTARSRISKPSFLAAKFRACVSSVYNQMLTDNEKVYDIQNAFDKCQDALKMLGTTAAGSLMLAKMVEKSCSLGCFTDTKTYCLRLQEVAERDTFEAILGELVHAILEVSADNVVKLCNKLITESHLYTAKKLISFLHSFSPKDGSQKALSQYTIAVLTAKYVDRKEGERHLHTLIPKIETTQHLHQ